MTAEGAANVFARHRACAAATRAGLEALGFELFADPADRSPTVTAAWIPEGLDWKAFNGELKRRGLVLAGGQGKLAGRIFRIGHLGSVTVDEILGAIATLEAVSVQVGRPVQVGAGDRGRPGRGPRRRGVPAGRAGRGMRILVAELIAPEGLARLRAAHDVDELLGRSPEEYRAVDRRLRRARRPQPGPGRRPAHRGRHPPPGRRPGRRRRRQRRPRGRDPGRHHRRQRPDREHDRGRRAHPRPAPRPRPADRPGRRLGPARRVEAGPVPGRRAARPDARHRRPRQDRDGHRRPGPGPRDGDRRRRSVRHERAGRDPRRRARRPRRAPRAVRRGHRPRAADARDARPHRRRGDREAEARRVRPQRRPRRDRRRGGGRRRAPVGPPRRRRRSTSSTPSRRPARRCSTRRTPSSRRTSAPRRPRPRSPWPRRSPSRSSTSSPGGPRATRSTRRSSAPRPRGRSGPYLPLAETLGRFFAQFARGGVKTLTLEVAGEPAEHDTAPLTAAVLRGLLETVTTERVNLVNAGLLAKARGITVVERKTPDAGSFSALVTLSGDVDGRHVAVGGTRRQRRAAARPPQRLPARHGASPR